MCLALVWLNISCSSASSSKSAATSGRVSPTYDGPPEPEYCSTVATYSTTVNIRGTALYEYRTHFGSVSGGGLGPVESTQKPIRYAEVRVLNSSGNVIQCGETSATGTFDVSVPKDAGSLTLTINSRAFHDRLKATVFNAPERKQFYSLTATVNSISDTQVGNLVATATGDLYAGAFNILDQLLKTSEYLKSQVGGTTCSALFPGCQDYTVAPKVEVFWEKGFNPGTYFNTGPLSFYLPGYSRLFILGGVSGNTDSSDTDHFDNSVIIHEFGHFIEDTVLQSDSPGGSHSGTKQIDPRLAWSEGWGNFIQAAVLNSPSYIDTVGNVNGTTDYIFYVDLENNACTPSGKTCLDIPANGPAGTLLGEGQFREFSVTRLLWDIVDPANEGSDAVDQKFSEIWAALTKTSGGWRSPAAAFRDAGLLHITQLGLPSPADWATVRTAEKNTNDRSEYAQYLLADNSCGSGNNFSLTPVPSAAGTGSFATSDLFRHNNFYHYHHQALGPLNLSLVYEDADASGALADLDLYLYNESGRFGEAADVVGISQNDPGLVSESQTESIALGALAPGHYLINVHLFTGGTLGGPVNYSVKLSGNNLCPATIPGF